MDESIGNDKTIGPDGKSGGHTYALKAGDTLGQYRIIRSLGAGGMGEVYEVEHEVLRRRYAIKLLPETLDWKGVSIERFRREAQVMANLDHSNILKVDDFGETGGRYWLRMELVEGRGSGGAGKNIVSLQDLAEAYGGKIPQEELLPILRQILEGLQYAHERGAIHRDLKPSNILLSSPSSPDSRPSHLVKIADFGLVRLVGEDWVRSQAQLSVQRSMSMGDEKTQPGAGEAEGSSTRALLGTFEYMSPEQKRGEEADERSDLYAVGVITYRLLTGRNIGPKLPSRIDSALAAGWDDFVEQALEEERGERLANASSALALLNAVGQELKSAEHEAAVARKQDEEARHRAEQARLDEQGRKQAAEEERKRQQTERTPSPPGPRPSAQRSEKAIHQVPAKTGGGKGWLWLLLIMAAIGGYFLFTMLLRDDPAPQTRVPEPVSPPAVTPAPTRSAQPARKAVGPTPGEDWTSPSTGMEFVWIRQMNMWVGKFEVTNGEYREKEPGHDSRSFRDHSLDGDRQPVVRVNFGDAKKYAEWLTQRDQEKLGKLQYRLPSEQEWQTFAQVGDGREYPWGNNWPPPSGKSGNYSDRISGYSSGYGVTAPVDELWKNPWGLYGVGGNVWEACASDSSGGSFGAWRGASWVSINQVSLRCSSRIGLGGSTRFSNYGFRLVLSR